jgi:hypothetical protein
MRKEHQKNGLQATEMREAVRDGIVRSLAVVGLVGIALIHLLDLPGTIQDTPYLGGMYLALMIGCALVAAALVRSSVASAWRAAAGLSASVFLGFVLSRTTGLPADTGDIGNWAEPLGMASLFVEGQRRGARLRRPPRAAQACTTLRRGAGGTGATCRRVRLERLRAGHGRPAAERAGTTDTLCEGRL